ncbi:hypothetical protein PGT21_027504 [Puccinia graminis f. sp. tritici]|uniref:Uncharacterized protein n=1 Tax=Puccinia graminis f. sp. tritici TaxID=56615 RepID=A0A5B0PNY9_PUCGR|nr:hypothetical protein PGT21_027504 [Puccinia graminis f. sp. tritici]
MSTEQSDPQGEKRVVGKGDKQQKGDRPLRCGRLDKGAGRVLEIPKTQFRDLTPRRALHIAALQAASVTYVASFQVSKRVFSRAPLSIFTFTIITAVSQRAHPGPYAGPWAV